MSPPEQAFYPRLGLAPVCHCRIAQQFPDGAREALSLRCGMRPIDVFRLVLLAAIWGAAFIFLRVAAPVLGPVLVAELRVLLAGVTLVAYARATGFDLELRGR